MASSQTGVELRVTVAAALQCVSSGLARLTQEVLEFLTGALHLLRCRNRSISWLALSPDMMEDRCDEGRTCSCRAWLKTW